MFVLKASVEKVIKENAELKKEVAELKVNLEKSEKDVKNLESCSTRLLELIEEAKWELKKAEEKHSFELKKVSEMKDIEVQKAVNKVREEVQKSLIESDLKRIEAIAKLQTYEKFDPKNERAEIIGMLKTAVSGMSITPKVNVVK